MKRFTELVEQLAEDYGAIYTYGSDLDSLGSGSYGVHNIGHPESLEKINQYVENFTKKLYFDPKQAIVELRAKMNLLGLDFDVTQQSANEGVYPLNSFGGSFGKTPDTPHNEWHKSDNITEKLGHGLQLNVDFIRVGDGMYQVEAEIVPSGLDYEDVEESAKMADKDYDGDGKVETGTDEWRGSRDKAIKRAMRKRKLNTEEVEEIDELKSSTLRSYHQKAQQDMSNIARDSQSTGPLTGKTLKKFVKRQKGNTAALSRLDARKQLGGAHPKSQRGQEWSGLARVNPKDKEN